MEVWIRHKFGKIYLSGAVGGSRRRVRSGPGLISGAWSEAREACGGPAHNPAASGALNTRDLYTRGNIINYTVPLYYDSPL